MPGKGARALAPNIGSGHRTPIGTYDGLRALSQSLNLAVRNLDKLTIAAINGVAIQTGLSLALACDFRIASTEARLGSGTLRFGLMPDEGGQYLLVQLLGGLSDCNPSDLSHQHFPSADEEARPPAQ